MYPYIPSQSHFHSCELLWCSAEHCTADLIFGDVTDSIQTDMDCIKLAQRHGAFPCAWFDFVFHFFKPSTAVSVLMFSATNVKEGELESNRLTLVTDVLHK